MPDAEITWELLRANSEAVPYPFATSDNRMKAFATTREVRRQVVEHAAGTRPILHEKLLPLIADFLAYKRQFGSAVERKFYAGLTTISLIDKLLKRRPLVFMNSYDAYVLRTPGRQGSGGFEKIGTARQTPPLLLADYNSYDEMQIAALLGVSTPTHFINDGNRQNAARPGPPGSFEPRGIYTGLVGARFEKPNLMEWRHMIVTRRQNTRLNGYGPQASHHQKQAKLLELWARFYEQGNGSASYFTEYDEAAQDTSGRFLPLHHGSYFNSEVYRRRMRMSVEPYLIDANARAAEAGRAAYVIAIGLGLGVWRVSPAQGPLLVGVFADVIAENRLSHIADIDFSWFPADCTSCGGAGDGDVLQANGNQIRIHFTQRNPAARLAGPDAEKLLVACYAWDGNAYPGNEYWQGMLSASGDPAAACCSNIVELQNPDVNPNVCGQNAHVARPGAVSLVRLQESSRL